MAPELPKVAWWQKAGISKDMATLLVVVGGSTAGVQSLFHCLFPSTNDFQRSKNIF
jgi:hypothetical protein